MELLKAREYQEALTQPEGAARNAEEILHVGIKTRGLNGPWRPHKNPCKRQTLTE